MFFGFPVSFPTIFVPGLPRATCTTFGIGMNEVSQEQCWGVDGLMLVVCLCVRIG